VTIQKDNETVFSIDPLFASIDTSNSSFKIMSTKIDLVLQKEQPAVRWTVLQGTPEPTQVPLSADSYVEASSGEIFVYSLLRTLPLRSLYSSLLSSFFFSFFSVFQKPPLQPPIQTQNQLSHLVRKTNGIPSKSKKIQKILPMWMLSFKLCSKEQMKILRKL